MPLFSKRKSCSLPMWRWEERIFNIVAAVAAAAEWERKKTQDFSTSMTRWRKQSRVDEALFPPALCFAWIVAACKGAGKRDLFWGASIRV
jgi:hypothetical protein